MLLFVGCLCCSVFVVVAVLVVVVVVVVVCVTVPGLRLRGLLRFREDVVVRLSVACGQQFDVCWGAPGEGREFRSVIRKILLPVPSWGASYEGKETMFPEGALGTQFHGGPGESHVPGSLSGNMISRCVWGGLLGLPRGSRRGRFRCSQLSLGEPL